MGPRDLVKQWAHLTINAAHAGALTGEPCPISRVETIAGPRAGVLNIYAGLNAGKLLRALSADDCALIRQFIPWQFTGEPQVFMSGRYVRCEAGWPDGLARKEVRLADLAVHPREGGCWTAGMNERGQTVVLRFSDRTPHFLLAGTTGSGKTVALRAAVLQLARDPQNRLILIDGKWGSGLAPVSHLPGVVGPLATDLHTARAALGWVDAEIRQRYAGRGNGHRLVVVFDEFQELAKDPLIAALLSRLSRLGRDADAHGIFATHHPVLDVFGDRVTRRNLAGRVALLVTDAEASRVAVGGPRPRADRLLGAGDAYCVAPGAVHRTQLVLVDERDFKQATSEPPLLEQWPEFHAEDLGQEPKVKWAYTGEELAVALLAAWQGHGRTRLEHALQAAGLGRPGAERARRLLQLGREQWKMLRSRGMMLVEEPEPHSEGGLASLPGQVVRIGYDD